MTLENLTFQLKAETTRCTCTLFLHSFIHLFIRSFIYIFTYLFIYLFIYLLFYVLILFSVRSCSSLSAPQNGFIYPHVCTVSPDSGTVCSFECRHGFSENGGVSMILCGNDGNWTKNESSILQCLGNCFVNYYINIDPNMCTL